MALTFARSLPPLLGAQRSFPSIVFRGPIGVQRAHDIVNVYALAFFDRHMKGHPTTLLWLNTLYLLFVAFIPGPSTTLEHCAIQSSAIAFYSLCLALTSLVSLIMWGYATRHHWLINAKLAVSSIH